MRIKLTEAQLHRVIKESVKKILRESMSLRDIPMKGTLDINGYFIPWEHHQ